MIRYALMLAIRNLIKRKFYAAIEMASLTIGIVAFAIIGLYLEHEFSYDRFFSQYDKIYRINHVEQESGNLYSGTSSALGYHAARELPSINRLARIFYPYKMNSTSVLVEKDVDTRFYEDNFLVADSTFFTIFDFQFTEGSAETSLLQPNGIVLSEKTARKYFGNEGALGKTLRLNNQEALSVTGVVDVPINTHLNFDFLRPIQHNPDLDYVWEYTVAFTYVVVEDASKINNIVQQLYQIVEHNLKDHPIDFLRNYRHRLQPLAAVHKEVLDWDIITAVPDQQLWMIGFVALIILVLAIVNFINLATSRSSERMKEVGMNKILGGRPGQLRFSYLGEAILISILSGTLAYIALFLLIPECNSILNTNIAASKLLTLRFVLIYIIFLILVGFIAGFYPATVLLKTEAIHVVKRTSTSSTAQNRIRQVLVIMQFTLTIILMSIMLLVKEQIRFMRSADLGYDQHQLMVVRMQGPDKDKFEKLKRGLLQHSDILKVAAASTTPGSETGSTTFWTDEMRKELPQNFSTVILINTDFLETLGLELLEGRNFEDGPADLQSRFIVNETVVKRFGLNNPLDDNFGFHGQPYGQIVGVVKDFHFTSLDSRIQPLVMIMDTVRSYRYTFVKLSPENIQRSIAQVEKVWNEQNPEYPIEYFFQDVDFNSLYKQHKQTEQMIAGLGYTALLLALFGLTGLSSFSILKRTKEIGIRKVFGASEIQIVILLAVSFLKLIVVAFIIATPITLWFGNEWLKGYAYHTNLSLLIFITSGAIIIGTSALTIIWQALRATFSNPINTLRND
ncbi:MAG: ABC transporter permease [Bacteroidota bacterium]